MPPRPRPTRRVALVGAGLAGTYAAAGLRRRGFDGHVTLVGAETRRPYDRPPLSKRVLRGGSTTSLEADTGAVLEDVCDDVRLGTTARRLQVDGDRVRVHLDDGEVAADAVLLATGAAPVVPPGWEGVATLRTLDDALSLRTELTPGARVVVVGAGWIGAEVTGAAAAAGCHVTVVEMLPAPLAREVGGWAGALTAGWYDGVRLLTGRRVVRAGAEHVVLDGGERVAADVVLAAVGVTPDVAWLEGSGLALDHGVRVRDDLRADGPLGDRVLAAGDSSRRWSPRYSAWLPGGHWETAMLGGDAAAASLLGEPVRYDPPPYVFSTQFGRELGLVGRPGPDDTTSLDGDPGSPPGAPGWSVTWTDPDGRTTALLTVDRPRDLARTRRALSRPPP